MTFFVAECFCAPVCSEREEAFESLMVQVKGYKTVVESLDTEYLDSESFTDDNQWMCSKCNKKVLWLCFLNLISSEQGSCNRL